MKKPELISYQLNEVKESFILNQELMRKMDKCREKLHLNLFVFFAFLFVSAFALYFYYRHLGFIIVGISICVFFLFFGDFIVDKILFEIKYGYAFCEILPIDNINYSNYLIDCAEYNNTLFKIENNELHFSDGEISVSHKEKFFDVCFSCECIESVSLFNSYKRLFVPSEIEIYAKRLNGEFCFADFNEIRRLVALILNQIDEEKKEMQKRKDDFISSNSDFKDSHYSQGALIEQANRLNSVFLNYLLEHQDEDWDILKCKEKVIHKSSESTNNYETAYIFTLNAGDRLIVLFENTKEARASIVCSAQNDLEYYRVVNALYNYMCGGTVNKRERLRSFNYIDGIHIKSINHNDLRIWTREMNKFGAVYKSSAIYHKRKRHWYGYKNWKKKYPYYY